MVKFVLLQFCRHGSDLEMSNTSNVDNGSTQKQGFSGEQYQSINQESSIPPKKAPEGSRFVDVCFSQLVSAFKLKVSTIHQRMEGTDGAVLVATEELEAERMVMQSKADDDVADPASLNRR